MWVRSTARWRTTTLSLVGPKAALHSSPLLLQLCLLLIHTLPICRHLSPACLCRADSQSLAVSVTLSVLYHRPPCAPNQRVWIYYLLIICKSGGKLEARKGNLRDNKKVNEEQARNDKLPVGLTLIKSWGWLFVPYVEGDVELDYGRRAESRQHGELPQPSAAGEMVSALVWWCWSDCWCFGDLSLMACVICRSCGSELG